MSLTDVGRLGRSIGVTAVLLASAGAMAHAQQRSRAYAGALFGVSTLSADGRSVTSPTSAEVSLYKPENGPAVNAFAGWDLTRFLTVQANYVWNRNDVALLSSFVSPGGGGFYQQSRHSSQHAVIGDALLYFRARGSAIRPYLSTGVGVVRFRSPRAPAGIDNGESAPEGAITATHGALRVAVGIDMALGTRWAFRYSFSETISGNPISGRLSPPGARNLANFQNLFGFVWRL